MVTHYTEVNQSMRLPSAMKTKTQLLEHVGTKLNKHSEIATDRKIYGSTQDNICLKRLKFECNTNHTSE